MHVVLANQWFLPERGGIGKYNAEIARAYRALGHQVSVIAKRPAPEVPLEEEIDGIRVRRIPIGDSYYLRQVPVLGRYARPIRQLLHSRRVDRALRSLHREHPIDVIEFAEVNAEGFFYARAPETPFVVRCHTPTSVLRRCYLPGELDFDTSIVSWCEKDLIKRAPLLTAPSRDMASVVVQECRVRPERICVIPNALSISEFTLRRSNEAVSSGVGGIGGSKRTVTVLHVGRLERVKGAAVLAEAVPLVLRRIPEARFVFAGGDRTTVRGTSQRLEIERRLEEANGRANVQFLGAVDDSVLAAAYRDADICVVPSLLYESFSYTCAEGMAAGKPVVASRIGGIPETVEDGVAGILVTPGSAGELAEAIVRLALDSDLRERMGAAGRERVAREFDPIKIAQRNIQVYERARADGPQGRLKALPQMRV